MTLRKPSHLLPTTLVIAAFIAACGGGAPAPGTPASNAASTSVGETPKAAPPEAPPASITIVPSKMIADVKAIGVDLDKPGDLASLDLSKKRKLMPLFVKALGMQGCSGCHVSGDFKAPTHNKEMATAMWTHFVRDLRAKGGSALFCDSCHQGKQKVLARTDKKLLATFMHDNYEEKLELASKKDNTCETCHSDPFEGKIFAKLWKVDSH